MAPQSSSVHILVVDDDAMSRDLLAILLEVEGYQVEPADSGEAALLQLSAAHLAPQVILADVQMPGISGSQLADALRQQCGPGTLLLAMSGSGPPPEAISRFDGFLMKPFSMQELAAVISSAMASAAASALAAASNLGMNGSLQEDLSLAAGAEDETGSATAQTPALDERIYNQLADAMPVRQLHQMYSMCMKDARDRIATMRRLAREHDALQFSRQAHAIKGGCGMLGATELYGMASHLETSGLPETAPAVNPLDELSAACDRLERILGARL